MSVFEDILYNLDITKEVYKVLGLPDPSHNLPLEDEKPLGSPTTVWLYANKVTIIIVGVILILVIYLLTLK